MGGGCDTVLVGWDGLRGREHQVCKGSGVGTDTVLEYQRLGVQWRVREEKEGTSCCQGTARQDVFVAFSYTKLALLMEWGGCRYNNPESRPGH